MNHVMIDVETLGVSPDAAIVSIGAVRFDPITGRVGDVGPTGGIAGGQLACASDRLHARIKFDSADLGEIDASTFEWWLGRSREAQDALLGGERLTLREALSALTNWLQNGPKPEGIWANDPDFDLVLLRSAYKRVDRVFPYSFRLHRSVRTMQWLACQLGMMLPKTFNALSHDALSDALCQAHIVSAIYARLGLSYPEPPTIDEILR